MKRHSAANTNAEESSIAGMFQYLIGVLEPDQRRSWKILSLLSLISPAVDIFSFSIIMTVINRAIQENQASPELVAFTLSMVGVTAVKCLLELYRGRLSSRFTYDGAQRLSVKVYETLMKEDLSAHYQKSAMQALDMVRQDTVNCIQMITVYTDIWVNCITFTGYGAVMIYSAKWIGIGSSLALVALMVVIHVQTRARMRVFGEKSRAYSIRTNAQITIAYGSFKEMKIDDRSAFVLKRYQKASTKFAQVQQEYQYHSGRISILLQNSVMGAMFAVLAVILLAGSNLAFILAPMLVFITALARMLQTAFHVLRGLNYMEFARKPFSVLKEALTSYDRIKAQEERTAALRRKTLTFRKGLSVSGLTFGYRDQTRIFDGASIHIPVGRSVAIIGASGAGKTTFLDLILGLLPPQAGCICYDDYDIAAHADEQGRCMASIGQLVSYIPQTVYLNGATIRDNVAFFSDERDIDNDRVIECLKCAQIWEDVQALPDGIDTLIGENGATISGGQRQRIALARALYKEFELLVMDEATAALDIDTERAVIDSIRRVKEGKTLLMVTHHMSLANECDIIYKIERKKLVLVKGDPS